MTVSSLTNKVTLNGNGTNHSFAYGFKIFADADLSVIIRSSDGTETTKTLNTHYVVTGAGNDSGGNVLFKYNTGDTSDAHYSATDNRPQTGESVIIKRVMSLTQGTDYVANDPFAAESHEDALDRLTFIVQQQQEEIDRAIKASVTNTITTTEFAVSASDRANKFFAFDSSGDLVVSQEIGTFRGNWAASTSYAQRDIVKDTSTNNIFIVNTAHTSSGSQPLTTNADSAKYDLLVDAASATTSATNASSAQTAAETAKTAAETAQTAAETAQTAAETAETNAETAETNAETAKTAAETAKTAAETALDDFTDIFLGSKSSDPTVDNDGNALIDGALVFNTTDNVLKVYDLGNTQWLATVPSSSDQTKINTVAGQISPTNNVSTVAGISSDISTVAGISSDVTTVAADGTDIGTVAGISSDVTSVAGVSSNVTTVAGVSSDVTTVAGISANVTTVAGVSANVTTVAGVSSDVTTVAGISANVTTAATNDANITTVASNITGVNSFAERYRVEASDPTTSLDAGDLAFVTGSSTLKYYDGSAWQGIAPGITSVSADSSPSLGGNLDVAGNSIVSASNGNISITPNGTGSVIIDGLSHPQSDGSAGQFLKTDGAGQLSFDTVDTGASLTAFSTETSFEGADLVAVYDTSASAWVKGTITNAALQGPAGADGAAGPTGPTGPTGPSGSSASTSAGAVGAYAFVHHSGSIGMGTAGGTYSGSTLQTKFSNASGSRPNNQSVPTGGTYRRMGNPNTSNNESRTSLVVRTA